MKLEIRNCKTPFFQDYKKENEKEIAATIKHATLQEWTNYITAALLLHEEQSISMIVKLRLENSFY